MPSVPSYVLENKAEREHLKALANRVSDRDLSRPLEAGWTVSSALAHLAFWDQRALVLVRKWKQAGVGPSPADADTINDAMLELCAAIPPRRAAEIALSSALAVDQEIEQLSPEMVASIAALGEVVRLNRAHHRRDHLGQIERVLGRKSA